MITYVVYVYIIYIYIYISATALLASAVGVTSGIVMAVLSPSLGASSLYGLGAFQPLRFIGTPPNLTSPGATRGYSVDCFYYISIHSLTLKCTMYAFFMALDDLRWVHDPFCGVLSAVRSSPPKTPPTARNN